MTKKRVTVLHVIEDLESGGAERMLIDIVLGLDQQRFRPLVCCLRRKGRMARELDQANIPVYSLWKGGKIDFSMLKNLRILIRTSEVDILHTHVFTANLWARVAGILEGVQTIITHEHSTFTIDNPVRRLLEKALNRKTDCTITVSQDLNRRLREKGGLRAETLVTLHNGLNFPKNGAQLNTDGILKAFGLNRFKKIIGAVGRLDPRKNFGLLLQAFKKILNVYPNAGLLLVGDGTEETALKTHAVKLDISERVIFAGRQENVYPFLNAMDVFCSSSDTEGVSIAILEAMAAGTPVVATRVGGTPEILQDREHGRLVPPRDVDALTAAMLETFENDKTTREMAQNAKRRVREHFSREKMVRRIEALYEKL